MRASRLLKSRVTLGVKDVATAVAFYADALGFELRTSMGEPMSFALLARDEVGLALVQSADPAVAGFACCYVDVEGVEALHERCVKARARIANPLTHQPWGTYDFVVQDPDGHKLAFGEVPARA